MADTVSLIANLALTLSLIVGVIFGIAQVRAAARDRRERLTLDSLRHFQTREFSELMHFMIRNRRFPVSQEGFRKMPVKEQITILQFAQEMESLGMLVAEHLIDLDLVEKTLGSFVTTSWSKYKTVFADIRAKSRDPFLGEYFQWLAERIDERMRNNPRPPFYETAKRPTSP